MVNELGSDSENEGEPGTESDPVFSSQSLLISHPTRKCVFEFLKGKWLNIGSKMNLLTSDICSGCGIRFKFIERCYQCEM